VGLVYPVLAYFFLRMLVAGFRPLERRDRLLPVAPRGLLVAGIVALVAFHTGYAATEGKVIDVGLAGVIGADRLTHGEDLYGEDFSQGLPPSSDVRGDVYGPVNYLAYVPFELAFPWSGRWDSVPAARAAALGFELLTALALFGLGRRLRPGTDGSTLGVGLAYAWLAYPFTMYTLGSSFNDSLVALLVVCCLLVVSSAPARGAMSALAGLTKFGPLILAPLFAAGNGERRSRPLVLFASAFLLTAAVVTIPLLPDGGFRELYDRSLGYQASRGSPFSVWGQAPSLHFLQTVTKLAAVALAAAFFFVPRLRSTVQLAALAAALLIVIQVTANHWFYPYVLWFAPLVLVTVFAQQRGPEPSLRARPRAAAWRVLDERAPPAAGGMAGSVPWSPSCSRARKSSTSRGLSSERSTTLSRSVIDETSSTCSLTNQVRNCSARKSPLSRASLNRSLISLLTRFSCSSAILTGPAKSS
jgi:hypothetical protein